MGPFVIGTCSARESVASACLPRGDFVFVCDRKSTLFQNALFVHFSGILFDNRESKATAESTGIAVGFSSEVTTAASIGSSQSPFLKSSKLSCF